MVNDMYNYIKGIITEINSTNITLDNNDFLSVDWKELAGERSEDGSLPEVNFMKLNPEGPNYEILKTIEEEMNNYELLDDGTEIIDECPLVPFGAKTVYRNTIVQNVCRKYPGGQSKEDVKVYNLCNDCIKQLEVWLKA